jgi:hypothetical protein
MDLVLPLEAKHHETRVIPRRMGADVTETLVERQEGTLLPLHQRGEIGIRHAPGPLVQNRGRVMTCRAESLCRLGGEALVDLEPHARG